MWSAKNWQQQVAAHGDSQFELFIGAWGLLLNR
jgi:hypothetical protein